MVFNQQVFMAGIKRYKAGLVIGAITGYVAAGYAIMQGYDLTAIVNAGTGLLDDFMTRSAPIEVAKYKLYGIFVFIGATVGFFADMAIHKFGKKR